MRTHRRVGITIFLLVLGVATIVVLSPESNTDLGAVAVESNGIPSGESGMRVYLDPETGEVSDGVDVNAVVEIDPEMANALSHDPEGLVTVRNADGSESLDLQGRYQEASVVRIDANGKVVVCHDNVASVEKTLEDTTPITVTPEVK